MSVDGDSGGVFLGQREIVIERPVREVNEIDRRGFMFANSLGGPAS